MKSTTGGTICSCDSVIGLCNAMRANTRAYRCSTAYGLNHTVGTMNAVPPITSSPITSSRMRLTHRIIASIHCCLRVVTRYPSRGADQTDSTVPPPSITAHVHVLVHVPSIRSNSYYPTVRLRPPIPEELPYIPHLADLIEIQLRSDELRAVAHALGDKPSARVAEVTLPVEFTDTPRILEADAVDRADEVRIGHCVRGLL